MAQYIDKDVLVAEVERRKQKLLDHIICESDKEWAVRTAHQMNKIIHFLDTIEVKEVDLDEEVKKYLFNCIDNDGLKPINIAKHFFELGINAQKGE